jgi:hypothetical protein
MQLLVKRNHPLKTRNLRRLPSCGTKKMSCELTWRKKKITGKGITMRCIVRERVVTKSRSGPVYAYIIPLKVGNVRRGRAVVEPFGASNAYGIWKMFI